MSENPAPQQFLGNDSWKTAPSGIVSINDDFTKQQYLYQGYGLFINDLGGGGHAFGCATTISILRIITPGIYPPASLLPYVIPADADWSYPTGSAQFNCAPTDTSPDDAQPDQPQLVAVNLNYINTAVGTFRSLTAIKNANPLDALNNIFVNALPRVGLETFSLWGLMRLSIGDTVSILFNHDDPGGLTVTDARLYLTRPF